MLAGWAPVTLTRARARDGCARTVLAGAFPGSQGIHDPTDLLTSAQKSGGRAFSLASREREPGRVKIEAG